MVEQTVGRCGATIPRLMRHRSLADLPTCTLPAEHPGWHRDADSRAEWRRGWIDGDEAAIEAAATCLAIEMTLAEQTGRDTVQRSWQLDVARRMLAAAATAGAGVDPGVQPGGTDA